LEPQILALRSEPEISALTSEPWILVPSFDLKTTTQFSCPSLLALFLLLKMTIFIRNPTGNYLIRVRVWLFFIPMGKIMGKKPYPAGKRVRV